MGIEYKVKKMAPRHDVSDDVSRHEDAIEKLREDMVEVRLQLTTISMESKALSSRQEEHFQALNTKLDGWHTSLKDTDQALTEKLQAWEKERLDEAKAAKDRFWKIVVPLIISAATGLGAFIFEALLK